MKPKNLISSIALLACPVAGLTGAASDADPARDADPPRAKVPLEVDSGAYVSKHDIVYLSPPTEGYEGLPIGNGDLGGMVWTTPTGILMQINKSDTFGDPNAETRMALRSCGRLTLDFGAPCFEWLYLKDFEGRLSLPAATASFRTETPFLKVSVEAWARIDRNVLLFQCHSEGLGDLQDGAVARVGLTRWGSRAFPGWYGGISRDPAMGLGNAAAQVRGKDIVIRETSEGLDFAMACRVLGGPSSPRQISRRRAEIEVQAAPRQDFTILLAVVTAEESDDPGEAAIALLDDSERKGIEALRKEHQRWWGDFWTRSFVSLGDDYIENLYCFKRYLMASSSRGRYPALFNGGIWTWNHDVRNWVTPHHWNMQQAYWSACASNDCDLLLPYVNAYWRLVPQAREHAKMRGADDSLLWSEAHDFAGRMCFWDRGDMLNNFTPASQIAGFFWQYYLYTGDEAFLREKAYPFLKGAAEFYLQTLQWDAEKGEYFIFPSQPYESPQGNQFRNPITDHGMIQATFRACLEASKILGADAGKRAQWERVLHHLWAPPKMNL
ncbi:MAG TPA: DUF5703 domain-containing protein, partial [Sumerlaeia bacterium]|nr:DUF5703 domain-containing protein [Sumerlaeia bacterium]